MNEHIYTIIAKKFSGEITPEELRELEVWLSVEGNRADYENMQLLWDESDAIIQQPSFNTSAAWEKVAASTGISETVASKPARTVAFPAWTKYALSAAAILLLFVLVWKPFSGNEMVVVLAQNENKEVTLPDNSKVTLRAGSTLSYPEQFEGNARKVSLEGEAFFKVTRNEASPFTINAQSASVTVLGTSFNVNCNDTAATVTVATGKVQMASNKNIKQAVILTPGESGILENDNLNEQKVDDANYMYWMTGKLVFVNKPFSNIVADIAKLHRTTITFSTAIPDSIKNQLINISFDQQPLEEMLTEICMVANCKWTKENNNYIISTIEK